jgi:hypothetical protein
MNLERHAYGIHSVALWVMTLCSVEGSFVSEESHCFDLQGRSEPSWKLGEYMEGVGGKGSCMTVVTNQRKEWGR